jgi:DNA-binding LacI/PurR family transcriptional regulator
MTAVFVSNDQMAIGVMHALAEAGHSVPNDVSVVGFDDIPDAAFGAPALTTVRQPLLEKGAAAARILLDHPPEPREVLLPVELIVRESSGPAPGA